MALRGWGGWGGANLLFPANPQLAFGIYFSQLFLGMFMFFEIKYRCLGNAYADQAEFCLTGARGKAGDAHFIAGHFTFTLGSTFLLFFNKKSVFLVSKNLLTQNLLRIHLPVIVH